MTVLDEAQVTSKLVLRSYQQEMVDFLLSTPRSMCTDAPGMGKTLMASTATVLPALISAPKHLLGQWATFLEEQYPNTKIAHIEGTRLQRKLALAKHADWYIINHNMLHSYELPTDIQTAIFDESHYLRNHKAKMSRAADAFVNEYIGNTVTPKVPRVYMLTATPMWKSVDDIWMQVHILYPHIFKSYRHFVSLYCITDPTPYGIRVLGIRKQLRSQLEHMLRPIRFGRTYADVGRTLPQRIDTTITLPLTKPQRLIYNDAKTKYKLEHTEDDNMMYISSSQLVHIVRQMTANAGKFDAIKEIIDSNNKPTLIGWWYKEHARDMQNVLGKDKCILITGDVAPEERRPMAMRAMRQGLHISGTIPSMTDGLNLSDYRQVIMGEEHYAPGSNHQFISRVVRDRNDDGKDEAPVLVYYVHADKTIDGIIHRLNSRREATMKDLVREILL